MKRGLISALLSGLVCPGAGQLYNRQYVKGAVMVAAALSLVGAAVYRTWEEMLRYASAVMPGEILDSAGPMVQKIAETNKPFYNKIAVISLVLWLYGIVDAYIIGKKRDTLTPPPDGD